jgi:hypothetical protein
LSVHELAAREVTETLSALVKTERDLEKAREELKQFLAILSANSASKSSGEKDLLH